MDDKPSSEGQAGKQSWILRAHSYRFMLWWSVAWGIAVMALAPLVNMITPFQDAAYANQWTPDIYWRLVMYWHGGLFIPWVTVLAVLAAIVFKLDAVSGIAGRLVKESIFVGGFFAVPVAGIAGIFDVYDQFAFGAPLWIQIAAFLVADEMAVALIVAMVNRPRVSGGYRSAGLPFYTILVGVTGALVAAIMGHVGGYITWFGPNPAPVSQYINSTIGYYNSTAAITFTENVVGSHSHLMLVSLMAGVVGLVGTSFGYANWSKVQRRIAGFGFAVMVTALLGAIWIYVISGVGSYSTPAYFVSGLNGVAQDDIVTGIVGFGAFFVLAALLMRSRGAMTMEGRPLLRDSLFVALIVSWILIYVVIPVTGFYINFNENYFQNAGLSFDQVFTRFHQDFGFFVLPTVVTLILAINASGVAASVRRSVGFLLLGGEALAFVFGETYALSTATDNTPYVGQIHTVLPVSTLTLDLAVLGGVLMAVGGLVAALYISRSSKSGHTPSVGVRQNKAQGNP